MAARILQMDFPYDGPWGEEAAEAMKDLVSDIAKTPGLRWKIWTENQQTGEAGGIYLFDDEASATAYEKMHTERLAQFGISVMRVKQFDCNMPLSRIARGPVE